MRMAKAIGLSLAMALVVGGQVTAQDGDDAPQADALQLDGGPSESLDRAATTAELRLQRAQERQRQRIARIEAREWMGYDPQRPTRAALPFTTSRYQVYVPYHVISPYQGLVPMWGIYYGR